MHKLALLLLFVAAQALGAASFDHFTGTSAPAGWTLGASGTGIDCMNGTNVQGSGASCTASVSGETFFELFSTSGSDTAFAYSAAISRTTSAIYWFSVRSSTTSPMKILLVDKATPAADTTPNTTGATGYVLALVQIGTETGAQTHLNRYNNARNQTDGNWNDSTKSWTNTATDDAMTANQDNYSVIGFEIDGATPRWRLIGCGNSGTGSTTPSYNVYCPLLTDWTNFSYHEGGGGFCNPTCGNLKFVVGDIVNNGDTMRGFIEYAAWDEGTLQNAWANIRDNGGTWTIRRFWGYPSASGFVERFVSEDRSTNSVNVGGASTWDQQHVKDGVITLGTNGTFYMCYGGARTSDGKFQVGYATASSPAGAWTKGANNPLVVLSAGTTEDQVANCVFAEDLTEPDPSKRWKLFYVGVDTSSPIKRYIYVRWCSAPPDNAACDTAGEWSAKTQLLGPGTGGNIDDLGYTRVLPYVFFGRPFLDVSSNKSATPNLAQGSYASGVNFGTAFTPSLVVAVPAQTNSCNFATNGALTTTRTVTGANAGSLGDGDDTFGCLPDQFVIIDDDGTVANYHRNRILRIVSDSTLALYHREDGMASGAYVRGAHAFARTDAGRIYEYAPGQWVRYGTCFDPMAGTPSFDAYSENICVWTSFSPIGPWTISQLASPAAIATAFGAQHSLENLSLVNGPLRPTAQFFSGPF